MQRTIAQYFAVGAFPGCIIPIYHKEKMNKMDVLFILDIKDDSEAFKNDAIKSINESAGEGGINGLNKRLKPIYDDMVNIIDYQYSATCTVDKKCNFMDQDATIKTIKG